MHARKARLIAFYLPQFHPIPENDQWWGKGFTEWTNVTRAKPLFKGHNQPQLPADLGFYDLRLPEARQEQATLAHEHGIEGFCYWHYWFHGKRLLEKPFDEVLASGAPKFPFCIAWANESWSRSWLGDNKQILIEQTYSLEDYINHARWLAQAFSDSRYIRVNGRPLFLIYRPTSLPNARQATDIIRGELVRLGLPDPYLVGINAHSMTTDMRELGFDMTEHHEPQLGALPNVFDPVQTSTWRRYALPFSKVKQYKLYSYADARRLMDTVRPSIPHFPAFSVGWDNTARRGDKAIIIDRADPQVIADDFKKLVDSVSAKPAQERIIFLNAWNEWAEGMHLEPDQTDGLSLLRGIHNAVLA
jgi:hypothetical protein